MRVKTLIMAALLAASSLLTPSGMVHAEDMIHSLF